MAMEVYAACADCFAVVAGFDDDVPAAAEQAVAQHRRSVHKHAQLHAGDDAEEFSRRPCEVCGSALGGTRHDIVAVWPE